jgi:hypothetical protein
VLIGGSDGWEAFRFVCALSDGRTPLIEPKELLVWARGSCGGLESTDVMVLERLLSCIGTGVVSLEARVGEESVRFADFDKERGRPQDVRRSVFSFLGLGGGLDCGHQKLSKMFKSKDFM